jgi:hypothetical protein
MTCNVQVVFFGRGELFMSQPVSGYQYKSISGGVGTAVISDQSATIHRVFFGGTYVGTCILHDSATAAGTSATSAVLTLGLPLAQYPRSIDLGIQCKNGIVYEATGTPVITVAWDK